MGTPIKPRRTRAIQPVTESLEDRQLLSRVVRGVDPDGDRWKLAMHGPGEFRVTTQNDVPTMSGGLIKTITVVGGRTLQSRLVGTIHKGPSGDGKVFFQNLMSLNNPPVPDVNGIIRTNLSGRGLAAIDIPGFYLGDTSKGTYQPETGQPTGQISVPTGVTSLRFGGVDTRAFAQPATRALTFNVNLGLPQYLGTSIITDTVTSSNRTSTDGTTALNDTVNFNIQGRLNVFQANNIYGDTTAPTDRYQGDNTGGTTISDGPDVNGTTGQIGNLQITGNATNLTVEVPFVTPSGATISPQYALISNFYIGGETNKVAVTAPGGMKNVAFGKGMDTVSIHTATIYHLVANRGAIGSTVIANGPITLVNIGGDVLNTEVLSGYFPSGTPTNPTIDVGAGGRMTVTVAGDITDSLFAASAIPLNPDGTVSVDGANTILFESGHINAKYEGKIDNSVLLPLAPNQAFFAKDRKIAHGPVVPPNVNEPPVKPAKMHKGQIALTFRPGWLGQFREANLKSTDLLPVGKPGQPALPESPSRIHKNS